MPSIEQTAKMEGNCLVVTRTYKFSLSEILKGAEYSVFKETGPDNAKRIPQAMKTKPKKAVSPDNKKAKAAEYHKKWWAKKKAAKEAAAGNNEKEKLQRMQKLQNGINKVEKEQDEIYGSTGQRP